MRKHGHIRDIDSEHFISRGDLKFVVDFYKGNGSWSDSGYYKTEAEARRELDRRCKRLTRKNKSLPKETK